MPERAPPYRENGEEENYNCEKTCSNNLEVQPTSGCTGWGLLEETARTRCDFGVGVHRKWASGFRGKKMDDGSLQRRVHLSLYSSPWCVEGSYFRIHTTEGSNPRCGDTDVSCQIQFSNVLATNADETTITSATADSCHAINIPRSRASHETLARFVLSVGGEW